MNQEGKNQKSIRTQNLMQALRIIIFQGPCSRKELAQQMDLSKMSITNIVNTFLAKGIVVEVEPDIDKPVTSGPKPVLLQLAPGRMVSIGIHITEYSINSQLFDIAGGTLCEKKILLEDINSRIQFVNILKHLIDQLLEYKKTREIHIIGIGITDNHFINRAEGTVVFKGNQLGIDIEFIKSSLEQKYNLPVYLEHEQMGALLMEMAYGLCDYNKKMYFLTISDEIRGAFTNEYYIQRGCVGLSGIVGHMSIKSDGLKCSCGNRGCYERYGSIAALLKDSNCATIKELNNSLQIREPSALRALENFIQATTIAITNIVNLYDPEEVVICGRVLELHESILKKIEYLVNNSIFFRKQRSISLIPSKLKSYDYNKGAAALVFYYIETNKDFISYICD